MFTLILVILAFTYGWIAATATANFLDKREERKRLNAMSPPVPGTGAFDQIVN